MTDTSEYTVWQLARLAECASPDSTESDGAAFLSALADEVDEIRERVEGGEDRHDAITEVADAAVPVYTIDVWRTFVDLAAWSEDPTELGADTSDMEQAAKVCLFQIAERLLVALTEDDEIASR